MAHAKIVVLRAVGKRECPVVSRCIYSSLVAQPVKNLLAMKETPGRFLGQEDPLEKGYRLPTPVFLGFPGGSAGKKSACSAGDLFDLENWGP